MNQWLIENIGYLPTAFIWVVIVLVSALFIGKAVENLIENNEHDDYH